MTIIGFGLMNNKLGRTLGLLRILVSIVIMIFATFMLPLSLIWGDNPPPVLEPLYNLPHFNWQTASVIIGMLQVYPVCGLIIFIGWQKAHPLKVQRIDLKEIITTKHASTIVKIGNGIKNNNGYNDNQIKKINNNQNPAKK